MGDLVPFVELPEESPMCKEALRLASFGFFVFPVWGVLPDHSCACGEGKHCGSPGKHPAVKSGLNAATTSADTIRKWWRKTPLANIGINAERSGLLVLDIDPRSGGDESLAQLEKEHGELPATYEVKTGGGGRHFYFKSSSIKSHSIAAGVDIKSRGGYVVAPPSTHHSGGVYEALHLGDPRGFLLPPPAWLVELATVGKKPEKKAQAAAAGSKTKSVDVTSGLFGAAFAHAGWLGDAGSVPNTRTARCPFDGEHTTGVRNAPSSSTVVFAPENGGVNGFVHCSHSHCGQRKQIEFWNALPEESRDHAKKQLRISPLYDPAAASDPSWKECWRSDLVFDEKGKLKQLKANASAILKNHPDFIGCVGLDTFKDQLVWLREPPAAMSLGKIELGIVKDDDFIQVNHYLVSRYAFQEFSHEAVHDVLRGAALPFHPVKKYLSELVWDQETRLVGWLTRYLGVPKNAYSQAVGTWWLLSAVARILGTPPVKADHVLILEGPQGSRKSTALRTLAGAWFADTPINMDTKDAYMALRGVWIYELQELQSLSKADADKAKAFFSSPVDKYRKPYGHVDIEVPRQCVFAGTVNYDSYLKDPSGNRRYWPVVTQAINIDQLAHDRDQLWAEAVHMFNLGASWYPQTEEEHVMCADEQAPRIQFEDDPWTPAVVAAIDGLDRVKSMEILNNPIHFPNARRDQSEANRIGRILRDLGWTKKITAQGKIWIRPAPQVLSVK